MDTIEIIKLVPVISALLVILEKLYGYGQPFLKKILKQKSHILLFNPQIKDGICTPVGHRLIFHLPDNYSPCPTINL